MTKALLYIPLLVGLLLAPALSWADFQAGREAYLGGDYETALKEWRPLAEQGDASAQYYLSVMYEAGLGVPEDLVLSHMWMNLAAAQALKEAIAARKVLGDMINRHIEESQRLAREWKPKQN